MSYELSTLSEGVIIHSHAYSGQYHLSVVESGKGITKEHSWPMSEYGTVLRKLWDDYLNEGKKPKLLEQTLSDGGLVGETVHYIELFFPSINWPTLDSDREAFIYWLKSRSEQIRATIGESEFNDFNRSLDYILKIHLEQKERK